MRGGTGIVIAGEPSRSLRVVLNVLGRSTDGVFAVDGEQRIVFWSDAAERILDRSAGDVLGRRCYNVLVGGGNGSSSSCRDECPTIRALRKGQGVPSFEICSPLAEGQILLNMSTIPVPSGESEGPIAIHMFRERPKPARPEAAESPSRPNSAKPAERPSPPAASDSPLTARESEILRLLAEGLTTAEIAARLTVSKTTVRNHVQRVLAKLGVHNRLAAVLVGARLGIV